MKLLIVTFIKEHTDIVKGLLIDADITIFSITETTGYNDGRQLNLTDNWFGKSGVEYDSAVLFSFTDEEKAMKVISIVNNQNKEMQLKYPIHAFVLPVESSTI